MKWAVLALWMIGGIATVAMMSEPLFPGQEALTAADKAVVMLFWPVIWIWVVVMQGWG